VYPDSTQPDFSGGKMSSKLHPDGKLNPSDSVTNSSGNDSILDLIEARQISRRNFLRGSLGAAAPWSPSAAALPLLRCRNLPVPNPSPGAIAAAYL
jgi:uncharacterized protein